MKKQITIALIAGAAALTYLILKKKYFVNHDEVNASNARHAVKHKEHHLTNAFSNAKKHALHVADN